MEDWKVGLSIFGLFLANLAMVMIQIFAALGGTSVPNSKLQITDIIGVRPLNFDMALNFSWVKDHVCFIFYVTCDVTGLARSLSLSLLFSCWSFTFSSLLSF